MKIPLSYSIKNVSARKLTAVLTAAGMAMVVFVFAALSMFAEGLEKTLVETGSANNVVVIRKGSFSDVQSGIEREQAAIIETLPAVAPGDDGGPLLAKEPVVLVNMPKKDSGKASSVLVRGIGKNSLKLRPQVRLTEGRLPRPGSAEIAVGSAVASRFKGVYAGRTMRFALTDWSVVGIFDAGQTAFSSEIWGDADVMMQAFRRPVYSSILFRLKNSGDFEKAKKDIEGDQRLTLEAKRETKYYAEQSAVMAKFLRVFALTLTLMFSTGAIIGAMITMYSAVANRVAEIGTLRALGFARPSILTAFLAESVAIGLAGGVAGLLAASCLQFFTVSTLNFQTFSEIAFSFTLTPGIAIKSLAASIAMGAAGGILPAVRASRMSIVDALRTG